jgi:hypothetical protein
VVPLSAREKEDYVAEFRVCAKLTTLAHAAGLLELTPVARNTN